MPRGTYRTKKPLHPEELFWLSVKREKQGALPHPASKDI